MPLGQMQSLLSGHRIIKSAVRRRRWLTAAGLLSVICLINGTDHSPLESSQIPTTCAHDNCQDSVCKVLPGLDYQGKHACASLAVDFKRAAATRAMTVPRVAQAPAGAGTFQLHSRPGATKVIYLDCDGHVTQNTPWNSTNATITTTAYDTDGNPSSFSASEQANIVEIWQRVAECYSPFDVDVTTEAPPTVADLINTGGGDTKWGIRALIGDSNPSPAPGAGGVAYVTGFGWNTGTGVDVPCFVLTAGLGTSPKFNADGTVHEVGHTVGLSHDGLFPASDPKHVEYYSGQGTGKVAWAPHMGVGYYVPLVQYSKGEYANASNTQDDLQIITTQNGFGYRVDDYANSQTTSKAIPGTPGNNTFAVNVSGVVETNTDSDWFKILAGSGTIQLNAVGGPANTMLDIQLSLYNSSGTLVIAANPATDVIASINQSITGGTYYVKIEGVALGDPLTTGYTKYGSLGQYTITGSYSTKGLIGAPVLAGPGDLFYGVRSQPTPINPNITVADPDDATLPSATVKITNVVSTQDVLSLAVNPLTMGNISSSYDNVAGLLTLTSAGATATKAQFQTALRAVSFSNSNASPTTTPRKVDFQVSDGKITSNILTSTVTIGYSYVTVTPSGSNILTIADDARDNAVVITLRGNQLTVEGAGGTRIGDPSSSVQSKTFKFTGDVILKGNFTAGNDSISLVGVKSSSVILNLGDGNDAANLTYCNVTNLYVDGGNGTDVVTLVGSIIGSKTYVNVP